MQNERQVKLHGKDILLPLTSDNYLNFKVKSTTIYFRKKSKLLPSSIVKVQITTLTIFWFNLTPKLCYLVQLTHTAIRHFYFSMHKLNFNLRLCRLVVNIIIYIKKIFDKIFINSFYIILYLKDKF
jgi:hypothetical protein